MVRDKEAGDGGIERMEGVGDGGCCLGRKMNGTTGVGETLREVRKSNAARQKVRTEGENRENGRNLQEE